MKRFIIIAVLFIGIISSCNPNRKRISYFKYWMNKYDSIDIEYHSMLNKFNNSYSNNHADSLTDLYNQKVYYFIKAIDAEIGSYIVIYY